MCVYIYIYIYIERERSLKNLGSGFLVLRSPSTPCGGEVLHFMVQDVSRETPDATPCRTSPPMPCFHTCLARTRETPDVTPCHTSPPQGLCGLAMRGSVHRPVQNPQDLGGEKWCTATAAPMRCRRESPAPASGTAEAAMRRLDTFPLSTSLAFNVHTGVYNLVA